MTDLNLTHLYLESHWVDPIGISPISFASEKQSPWAIVRRCDRRTDRQTDRQTEEH